MCLSRPVASRILVSHRNFHCSACSFLIQDMQGEVSCQRFGTRGNCSYARSHAPHADCPDNLKVSLLGHLARGRGLDLAEAVNRNVVPLLATDNTPATPQQCANRT
jgi:hypothetical protein